MQSELIDLFPIGRSGNFRITREPSISVPVEAMEKLGWQYEDEIASQVIAEPLCLLLWRATAGRSGYTLHPNGAKPKNGTGSGKLSMSYFIKHYLEGKVCSLETDAPIDVVPSYIDFSPYQVALMFKEPQWAEIIPFVPATINTIRPEDFGIYFLLSRQGTPLKIGKGRLIDRLKAHHGEAQKRELVTHVRYFVTHVELIRVLEKIYIARHVAEYGDLPLFNKINA
jgi:hypothetical protein